MLTAKQQKTLSEALGHLGRGVKKLKWVVDSLEIGSEIPETSGDDEKSEAKLPPFLIPPDKCFEGWSVGGKFLMAIGETIMSTETEPYAACMDWLFGNKLRADKYRNQWLASASAKRGWRKIPEADLEKYRAQANNLLSDCEVLFLSYKPQDFAEFFFEVKRKERFWVMQDWFMKANVGKKQFRNYLINVHASLPALR